MRIFVVVLIFLVVFGARPVTGQSKETLSVRAYVSSKKNDILKEYLSFLSIPNVASDSVNIRRNAKEIMRMMSARGIANVRLLNAKSKATPPAVYGEVLVPGAKTTLIFYAHYDGQPVNPAQWAPGLSPFEPRIFKGTFDKEPVPAPYDGVEIQDDWRIYARAASDDKAGVAVILNAYDAVRQKKMKLRHNIKFFFEGEEEAGSPHLSEILEANKSLLAGDLWVICDGPVHQTGKKVVSFGVRGDAHVDVTVYGPKRPLHSGHYGNWAPNPGMMLAHLLTSMKDAKGKVLIEGFYDDVVPLTEKEKEALKKLPAIDEQMKAELGLGWTENEGMSLAEAINLPSLNINGMQSGNVGKMASNQIPTSASAVIDLRLVLGNDWRRQQQKVVDHIKRQGYHVIDHEPSDEERALHPRIAKVIPGDDGYNAQRTPMDLPIAGKIIKAVSSTVNDGVVLVPTSGGSLPLFVFEKYLGSKTIAVPVVNHDNNQHAENENVRIGHLFTGIETMAMIMIMD